MINIESAFSSACCLNSPPSVIASTPPNSHPLECRFGFFRGVIWALLIETGGVALLYGAILTLRMACR